MITSVFILGNHIQSLGLARQISVYGADAILFTDNMYSITRFSNAIKQSYLFNDTDDLMDKILRFTGDEKNTLLFPTNDVMVDFLSKNFKFLSERFYIGIPDPAIVEIFADKRKTYRFAAKYNIPAPISFFPESIEDVQEISEKVDYPVIIKPAFMHSFHKTFGKKAYKCNNREELFRRVNTIAGILPIDQLIIQEYLDGGAKSLYSYGTFAVNGTAIASIIANRTRQNPMDFGNSTTYAKTCYNYQIQLQAEKILSLTNYSGLAEVEFMYDVKTSKFKFLEINTRAWKWHSISNGLGFSFIGKMLDYLNYEDTSEIKNFTSNIGWIERLTDTTVVLKELLHGNNLLKETLQSYRIPKQYAVWSKRDILPFFMYFILSPILFFKRH